MLSSSFGSEYEWNFFDKVVVEITAPFQKAFKFTVNSIEDLWLGYFYLVDVRRENKELKKKVDQLLIENSKYRELLSAYKRLQALLKFKQTFQQPVVAAQVIGLDPSGWFKSIIIDKGSDDGIMPDMPVVNALGVVGRVVSVCPDYSKVLLIIDQNSAVDCLLQRTRARAMVKGVSSDMCKLDYVVKSTDVAIGDMIVTSGLGGVFPKGLPVGKVSSIKDVSGSLFKQIQIRPLVDFSKLEEVLIIQKKPVDFNK